MMKMKVLLFICVSCLVYSNGMNIFFKHSRNTAMKRNRLDMLPEENMNAVS